MMPWTTLILIITKSRPLRTHTNRLLWNPGGLLPQNPTHTYATNTSETHSSIRTSLILWAFPPFLCLALTSSIETILIYFTLSTCASRPLYNATALLTLFSFSQLHRYHHYRHIVVFHTSDFFFFFTQFWATQNFSYATSLIAMTPLWQYMTIQDVTHKHIPSSRFRFFCAIIDARSTMTLNFSLA